ncbi:MAG: ZIP family metal transporter, partial [Candidatus Tectomicrobia bacterium]|nr:ZIP family metal transporter [Candidatus Tectomicrobia bacterium]
MPAWEQVLLVFVYASITALATGLGALPFLFVRGISERAVAYANAVAAGLMLGASFGLIIEGSGHGAVQTLAGAGIGVVFILVAGRMLHHHDMDFGAFTGGGAKQIFLI